MTIVVLCQRRTGQKGFETTEAAAPAARSGNFIGAGPWQRIVTPLSGDCMCADQYLPSDGYPTSYARPEDDAEYRFRRGSGAVCRLGQGEAIGVVGESRRPPKCGFDILLQRASNQPGGVCVLDEAGHWGDSARYPDTNRRRHADFLFDGPHQSDNRIDRAAIVLRWRSDTMAKAHRSGGVYRGSLDLGAAEIDADAKPSGHGANFPQGKAGYG